LSSSPVSLTLNLYDSWRSSGDPSSSMVTATMAPAGSHARDVEGIMGRPTSAAAFGVKTLYVYPNPKVTFENDAGADIRWLR